MHQPEGFPYGERQRWVTLLKAFLEAQWHPSVAGQSPVTCPGYLSSPATPAPCWTLDSGPCPRWPPHQLARRIRASAQISNVTLSDSRLCLSQHPILLPHCQLSSLTSPLSIQPPTARIYLLSVCYQQTLRFHDSRNRVFSAGSQAPKCSVHSGSTTVSVC